MRYYQLTFKYFYNKLSKMVFNHIYISFSFIFCLRIWKTQFPHQNNLLSIENITTRDLFMMWYGVSDMIFCSSTLIVQCKNAGLNKDLCCIRSMLRRHIIFYFLLLLLLFFLINLERLPPPGANFSARGRPFGTIGN